MQGPVTDAETHAHCRGLYSFEWGWRVVVRGVGDR